MGAFAVTQAAADSESSRALPPPRARKRKSSKQSDLPRERHNCGPESPTYHKYPRLTEDFGEKRNKHVTGMRFSRMLLDDPLKLTRSDSLHKWSLWLRRIVSWNPGYKNITRNGRADSVAKEAATLHPEYRTASYTFERHGAKDTLLEDRNTIWSNAITPNSAFAPADQLKPALKPQARFRETGRTIYGRAMQRRTGHAFMGEHCSSFVPNEDTLCPSGERIEIQEHIFIHCPLLEDKRYILLSALEHIVTDLLGTEEGFQVVLDFFTKLKVFKKRS